ncbi:hypothetical protein FRC09_008803 [Ceratobasidium sp. 395]|nr:hypothetical protein FRC09_008803 [Ceratobasidium sp. 395]
MSIYNPTFERPEDVSMCGRIEELKEDEFLPTERLEPRRKLEQPQKFSDNRRERSCDRYRGRRPSASDGSAHARSDDSGCDRGD